MGSCSRHTTWALAEGPVGASRAQTREREEIEDQGAGFEAPSKGFKSYLKRSSGARCGEGAVPR
eukprot:SAG11_NODE_1330_length_5187_cov_6.700079_6_plen_64_part_00